MSWKPPAIPNTLMIAAKTLCSSCSQAGTPSSSGGVRVRACSVSDPKCDYPLATGESAADGRVSLTVSTMMTVNPEPSHPMPLYLEFHKDGSLDTLVMLNTPPVSSNLDVGSILMDQSADEDALAAGLGTSIDPTRAVVKLIVRDCSLRQTDGADVWWQNVDASTKVLKMYGASTWDEIAINVPVRLIEAGITDAGATPAPSSVLARAYTDGPVIAHVDMIVRPGSVTLVPFIAPTPTSGP